MNFPPLVDETSPSAAPPAAAAAPTRGRNPVPSMIISVDGTGAVHQCREGLSMDEDHGCNKAPPAPPTKKRKVRQKSKKINDARGKLMNTTPSSESAKIFHLSKHQPSKPIIVKSPMFMTSPSSIYMAICEYNSLMEAMYGGISTHVNGSGDSGSDTGEHDTNCHHRRPAAGDGVSELEYFLILINIYFGGCPIFDQTFNAILADTDEKDSHSKSSSPATVIETTLHKSVRHLCSHECFLRAYNPIREFSCLWRDIRMIDHTFRKKGSILSGWRCCQYAEKESRHTNKKSSRSLPLVYISPDGMEFNTKTKVINYMNTLFPTQNPNSLSEPTHNPNASTPMIDLITTINQLYSPLGLLEELFVHDPWKLLVSAICLNVTTRAQVDKVLHNFLQRWPDAHSTANETSWLEICNVISPLGLGMKRATGLIRFSQEYLSLTEKNDPFSLTESQVKGLHHIGKYGWAAYELFIRKRLPVGSVKVCDHALQLYVEYQLGRRAMEYQESSTVD